MKTRLRRGVSFALVFLFNLLVGLNVACRGDIVPNLPDRRQDASAALQAAFDQSGLTGEPVQLRGWFWTSKTLYLRGGNISGQLDSISLNWTADPYAVVGPVTVHARHGGDVLVCSNGEKTYRPPVVRGVALVCYHQSQKALEAVGVRVTPGTAPTIDHVLIDAAGVGLLLEGGSKQHRVSDLYIWSPRTAGIRTLVNYTVADGWFRDVYVNGKQHPDYVPNPPPTGALPVGIDGLPISSTFHGRTLLEFCQTAVRTGRVLNTHFEDLFIDSCLGTGIEVSDPYGSKDYLKELSIGRLQMQASAPSCVPWKWAGTGQAKATVRVGADRYSTAGAGSWVSTALRPGQIVFLPFQQ